MSKARGLADLSNAYSDEANRHYAAILRQLEAGELTIQDAD